MTRADAELSTIHRMSRSQVHLSISLLSDTFGDDASPAYIWSPPSTILHFSARALPHAQVQGRWLGARAWASHDTVPSFSVVVFLRVVLLRRHDCSVRFPICGIIGLVHFSVMKRFHQHQITCRVFIVCLEDRLNNPGIHSVRWQLLQTKISLLQLTQYVTAGLKPFVWFVLMWFIFTIFYGYF